MCPHSCTKSTVCTRPRVQTRPINCNIIPQKDTMTPCMSQPHYPLNSQVLAIFFLSATISAMPHYPEFTDRYSPQYGKLSFSLRFTIHTAFLLSFAHFHILSQSQGRSRPMHATIPDPTDRLLMSLPPPSLSHSPDLGCVGAQRIMFLGRFLV